MSTSPTKKHPKGARIMEAGTDMETFAEVKKVDEGDEDETMEADGGVYVVESILSHHTEFEDDETRYLVKWKGYDESEQTWELEDQFVGSQDVLEAYWAIIGGKPAQKTKRRGRHASGSVKKRLSVKSAADESVEWLPPVPSAGNWEALVQDVEIIDKDEKGSLWAYLVWSKTNKDGGPIRNKAPIRTCYKACPQKMLKFYEKHLVLHKSKALQLLLSNTVQHAQISVVEPEEEDVDELV